MACDFSRVFLSPSFTPQSPFFWTKPRDPITETENGFIEPKYLAFHFGDYTPQSSSDKVIGSLGFVIILQLLQLVHFWCHSPILEALDVKVVNAQKTHAKVPHIQHHQWHHHRHDSIPQSKPMVQNSNCFGKTKLDIKTGVYTSQTCDNQQNLTPKNMGYINDLSTCKRFTFRLVWWRKTVEHNPPNPNLETLTESGRDLCCPKFSYTISYKFIGWTNSFRWEMVG